MEREKGADRKGTGATIVKGQEFIFKAGGPSLFHGGERGRDKKGGGRRGQKPRLHGGGGVWLGWGGGTAGPQYNYTWKKRKITRKEEGELF